MAGCIIQNKPRHLQEGYARQSWGQEHRPNLTGTIYAHRPQGHILAGGKRKKATGDYEAWKPE